MHISRRHKRRIFFFLFWWGNSGQSMDADFLKLRASIFQKIQLHCLEIQRFIADFQYYLLRIETNYATRKLSYLVYSFSFQVSFCLSISDLDIGEVFGSAPKYFLVLHFFPWIWDTEKFVVLGPWLCTESILFTILQKETFWFFRRKGLLVF